MQKIILLSGFGGTGKSTIGKLLHEQLQSNAMIEADALFHIKPLEIGEKLGRVKLKNSLSMIKNFLEEEYEYIIVVGLVWAQHELDRIIEDFAHEAQIMLFWLELEKEKRFERVMERGESGDTLEFLEEVEQKIVNPWPFNTENCETFQIAVERKNSREIKNEIIEILNS